jgi:hypothetical protein
MSITWDVDHHKRFVVAELRGKTTEEELYSFLGTLIGERVMDYGKLIDATAADGWLEPAKIQAIAKTTNLYSRMKLGPVGPLAIVVNHHKQEARAREYIALSGVAERRVSLFGNRPDAEGWLAELLRLASRAG